MHAKKMVAPIIISGAILIYIIAYIFGWSLIPVKWHLKLAGLIIPVIIAGLIIYVLIERINEIRSGEEDDLSKY